MAVEFTITALRVVREVAARRSFSAAATELGYTQSAVSRQVALAERAAVRPLFERLPRGVRLTEAGEVVLRHAHAVLAELDTARRELDDLTVQPARRIRVGAFSTALASLVPRAIAALSERRPGTQVVLREGTSPVHLRQLAAGRLDVAVVNVPGDGVGAQLTRLVDDPVLLAVAASHPLAGRASVEPDELRNERWVAATLDRDDALLGAWSASDWAPDVAFLAKDWVAKLGLVAAGVAVTLVPGIATSALPPAIRLLPIDHPSATRATAVAVRPAAAGDEHVHAFVELLHDAAAAHEAELRRRLRR